MHLIDANKYILFVLCSLAPISPAFAQSPAEPPPPPPPPMPAHPAHDPNPGAVTAPTEAVPSVDSSAAKTLFSGLLDTFDYDPRGRRDPFSQPIEGKPMAQGQNHGPLLPLQRFDLKDLRLTGILWDVNQPKAMIKDPSGAMHIVVPNAKIGPRNGYVASIREGEIIVVETIELDGRLVSSAQVVKLAK